MYGPGGRYPPVPAPGFLLPLLGLARYATVEFRSGPDQQHLGPVVSTPLSAHATALSPMLAKLLLTVAVVAIAWVVLRARHRAAVPGAAPAPDLLPAAVVRAVAAGLLALLLIGSAIYLYSGWQQGRQVVTVSVINPYTGAVQTYRSRRRDVEGRSFRTLDGQRIHIAEMERMVVAE